MERHVFCTNSHRVLFHQKKKNQVEDTLDRVPMPEEPHAEDEGTLPRLIGTPPINDGGAHPYVPFYEKKGKKR